MIWTAIFIAGVTGAFVAGFICGCFVVAGRLHQQRQDFNGRRRFRRLNVE